MRRGLRSQMTPTGSPGLPPSLRRSTARASDSLSSSRYVSESSRLLTATESAAGVAMDRKASTMDSGWETGDSITRK